MGRYPGSGTEQLRKVMGRQIPARGKAVRVCQQVLWSSEQSVTLLDCLRGGAHDPKKPSKLSWVGGRSPGFRANLRYFISGPGFASCDLRSLFSPASVTSPAMVPLP